MRPQDLLLIAHAILFTTIVYRGVTGPRHTQTHVAIALSAPLTPLIAFDLGRLADVPWEAWAFCGAFVVAQIAHTAFHVLRPREIHANGPEILFQPIICLWATALRVQLDPSLWYRSEVGVFFFLVETLFLSLGVLMLIYMAESTSIPDDEIDLLRDPVTSRSNAAFLTAIGSTTMVTLYVTTLHPAWLLAAVAAFAALRAVLARPTAPA
ncbi:MAG TPA: hypothetical protein PKA64_09695 [Myxococcota bacterium]|nr:hypothetical protein [Myxococcota bacterium]